MVRSPSGVLASPVSDAEKGRRVELLRFVRVQIYISLFTPPPLKVTTLYTSRSLSKTGNHNHRKVM